MCLQESIGVLDDRINTSVVPAKTICRLSAAGGFSRDCLRLRLFREVTDFAQFGRTSDIEAEHFSKLKNQAAPISSWQNSQAAMAATPRCNIQFEPVDYSLRLCRITLAFLANERAKLCPGRGSDMRFSTEASNN
jgi:hypothetical protein